jgi:hypothetical protein
MPRNACFLIVSVLLTAVLAAPAQTTLPVVEDVPVGPLREHSRVLLQALQGLNAPLPAATERALKVLLQDPPGESDLAVAVGIQKLLDPFCLVGVSINPESRVKAARGPAAAELRQDRETVMLIKIHNEAGVTQALEVSGPQVRAQGEAASGRWLEVKVHAEPPVAKTLGGHQVEYVILRLTPREAGKREATLKFDVGQGTQDLGFRAEVPVLFLVRRGGR